MARLLYKTEAKFLTIIETQSLSIGTPFCLECEVEPENTPVRWFRNDVELDVRDNYDIVSNGGIRRITFEKYEENDSGNYFVKIEETKDLYCYEPLRIAMVTTNQTEFKNVVVYGLNDISTAEGNDVNFKCKLQTACDSISWYKGEKGENTWPASIVSKNQRIIFDENAENKVRILENIEGPETPCMTRHDVVYGCSSRDWVTITHTLNGFAGNFHPQNCHPPARTRFRVTRSPAPANVTR